MNKYDKKTPISAREETDRNKSIAYKDKRDDHRQEVWEG